MPNLKQFLNDIAGNYGTLADCAESRRDASLASADTALLCKDKVNDDIRRIVERIKAESEKGFGDGVFDQETTERLNFVEELREMVVHEFEEMHDTYIQSAELSAMSKSAVLGTQATVEKVADEVPDDAGSGFDFPHIEKGR